MLFKSKYIEILPSCWPVFSFSLLTASQDFRMVLGDGEGGELDTKAFYCVCGALTWTQRIYLDPACISFLPRVVNLPVTTTIL